MLDQYLLADVRLVAEASLLGATVIDIIVDIAVLLLLCDRLGRNGATAGVTSEKPAQGLRVFVGFLLPAAQFDNLLHFVKKFLTDDGRMAAMIYLSAVLEVAVVKSVGEHFFHSILRPPPPAGTPVSASRLYPILIKIVGDVFKTRLVLGVHLEGFEDDGGFPLVHHDRLRMGIVQISDASGAGKITAHGFFLQSARSVIRQVPHVLIGHGELHAHRYHVIFRLEAVLGSTDMLDHALLQKFRHLSAVLHIAGDAVQLPCKDALRLALLDAPHHLVVDRASGHFGRPAFLKLRDDQEAFLLGELAHDGHLVGDGIHLPLVVVGTFAGVEKVVHSTIVLYRTILQ